MQPERGLEKKADAARKAAMAAFAGATGDQLRQLAQDAGLPLESETMRGPETGLVTVRGRIGGGGAVFNTGEATVTRATVRLPSGQIGHAFALGRDKEKVRLAAILDALWCSDETRAGGRAEDRAAACATGDQGRRPQACRNGGDQGRFLHHGAGRRLMVLAEHITGGFGDPVFNAQSVFRSVMDAMARPGTVSPVASLAGPPAPLSPTAAAIALTLCDQDTPVWLDASLRALGSGRKLDRLPHRRAARPHAGRRAFRARRRPRKPDGAREFRARHAGISRPLDHARLPGREPDGGRDAAASRGRASSASRTLAPTPLPRHFVEQWKQNRARFPRGVDLILAARGRHRLPAAHHPHPRLGGLSHVCRRQGRRSRHPQRPPAARRPPARRPQRAGAAPRPDRRAARRSASTA